MTRVLGLAGHDVRLFVPAHGTLDRTGLEVGEVEFLRSIGLEMGGRWLEFSGLYAYLPGTPVQVYLIECPELFHRDSVYTGDPDEAIRFAFFTRAVIECCQRMGWSPQVFHANDWHTALLPVYLRGLYSWDALFAASRVLLTIHNVGYQGVFGAEMLHALGLDEASWMFPNEDLAENRINLLKTGLLHADLISTVSPTHALEIQTPEGGRGLDGLLRYRSTDLVGILNGIDDTEWDPANDRLLPHPYHRDDLRGKAMNKRALLKELGLASGRRVPLIGMVTRLVEQKGIDLLPGVLPELLEAHDCRMAILGSGRHDYESFFEELAHQHPDRVGFYCGYNNQLAHRIEAASDIYLMPSLYEPCGLNQMYSLRYGAVPVVRRTGGLADSVEPFDSEAGSGTGFLFDSYDSAALAGALEEALAAYGQPQLWRRLVRNGMSQDLSWEHQVGRYIELYDRLQTG